MLVTLRASRVNVRNVGDRDLWMKYWERSVKE